MPDTVLPESDLAVVAAALRARRGRDYEQAESMPGAFYTSPALLQVERRALFRREWICVGRADELPDPGDYMTFDILEEPVLIIRGDDGEIRALSNVCRHRGMLVAAGRGNGKHLSCPYHAWTYDSRGRLVAAPHMNKRAGFDRSKVCLPAFRSEIWQGFIFVTLDAETPPLAPRLSGLEEIVRNYHFEEMTVRHVADTVWDTNWKCLVENFMEGYHLSPLHRTTLHPVNPTKLCRHFPPGDAYFGYYAGFDPSLARTTKGHPDLSDEEADRCVMFAVPPGLTVGGAADYSTYLCLQPETPERVRVKQALFFHGDHWTQAQIDRAVELFDDTMAEDKVILQGLTRGLQASRYATGPLAGSDYEGPIWDFIQYLERRLGPHLPPAD
ncbi:MAG TPA: aromatic ring-hydroxylating dioxygenase subunit alpha [Kiloniellaceae bacterium]|nr:aromatic ring-hydroxylating dioxygenase subunit alpha [Kiloniellaceae bacterium]